MINDKIEFLRSTVSLSVSCFVSPLLSAVSLQSIPCKVRLWKDPKKALQSGDMKLLLLT